MASVNHVHHELCLPSAQHSYQEVTESLYPSSKHDVVHLFFHFEDRMAPKRDFFLHTVFILYAPPCSGKFLFFSLSIAFSS